MWCTMCQVVHKCPLGEPDRQSCAQDLEPAVQVAHVATINRLKTFLIEISFYQLKM